MRYFIKSRVFKENLIIVIVIAIVVPFVAWAIYADNNRRNEIYVVLNNPTFSGTVIDKESFTQRATSHQKHMIYRLHIVGKYLSDNEIVHVDRVFMVPRYLYDQFYVGSLINQQLAEE